MNIGVIYNSFCYKTPLPEEAEMRATALAIGSYLSRMGYQVQYFDMDTPAAVEALCASHLDAAFNACERVHDSARGEIYAAALLEYLGIPQTRTAAWRIALGISKVRVKAILSYYHIPTPRYQIFERPDQALDGRLMYPLFVKGMASENSIGIDEHSLVHGQRELSAKVEQIVSELHQPALVEEYIAGRELGAAILPGRPSRVLPISEIVFGDLPEDSRFLDYQAKWQTESQRFQQSMPVCPAALTETEQRLISATALKCYHVLRLDSYARIDLRYRGGVPYVLEVNQNPSIGEVDCGYVRTCQQFGLDYMDMIRILLRNALSRTYENCRIEISRPDQTGRGAHSNHLRRPAPARV